MFFSLRPLIRQAKFDKHSTSYLCLHSIIYFCSTINELLKCHIVTFPLLFIFVSLLLFFYFNFFFAKDCWFHEMVGDDQSNKQLIEIPFEYASICLLSSHLFPRFFFSPQIVQAEALLLEYCKFTKVTTFSSYLWHFDCLLRSPLQMVTRRKEKMTKVFIFILSTEFPPCLKKNLFAVHNLIG